MNRIKLLQEELKLQLEDSKEKLKRAKIQKQKEIAEDIQKSYADEIQALENDIFKLKMQQGTNNTEDMEAYEQNARKNFNNEQDMKFQIDKEELIRSFRQKTAEIKDIALQKHREEVSNLYKRFETENLKQEKEELDPGYETELGRDLKAKNEDYKTQINHKIEIIKLEVQDKIIEYEKEKIEQFRENLNEELSYLNQDFQQFKEALEADFVKEKTRLQKKSDDEISALSK